MAFGLVEFGQNVLIDETMLKHQSVDEAEIILKTMKESITSLSCSDLINNTKKSISLLTDSTMDIYDNQKSENKEKDKIFGLEDDEYNEIIKNQDDKEDGDNEDKIENFKTTSRSDTFQDQDNNRERNDQSSDLQMEMSLPSFGFNITFDKSKGKPIMQEVNNKSVVKAVKVVPISDEEIDVVIISNTSDETMNTLSKENMPILNERSKDPVDIRVKTIEDTGVKR